MRRMIVLLATLALAGCTGPPRSEIPAGKAVAIDGDTFAYGEGRYRLLRIDAPEFAGHCRKGRACVQGDPVLAKQMLQRMLDYSRWRCTWSERDVYGRYLVDCWSLDKGPSLNLSQAMLATGTVGLYAGGEGR